MVEPSKAATKGDDLIASPRTMTFRVDDRQRVAIPHRFLGPRWHQISPESPVYIIPRCVSTSSDRDLRYAQLVTRNAYEDYTLSADAAAAIREEDSESPGMQALRLGSNRIEIKIELHGELYRITLPEKLRREGVLPSRGGYTVCFTVGAVVELWKEQSWHENLASVEELVRDDLARQTLIADIEEWKSKRGTHKSPRAK